MDTLLTLSAAGTPEDSEVVAGPLGFALWIFLILAVVILGRSLVTRLRNAEAAKAAGLYGDEPVVGEDAGEPADEQVGEQAEASGQRSD